MRRGVAEHGAGGGGNLRVRQQLVSVTAERLTDLVLELRYVSAVPGRGGDDHFSYS